MSDEVSEDSKKLPINSESKTNVIHENNVDKMMIMCFIKYYNIINNH